MTFFDDGEELINSTMMENMAGFSYINRMETREALLEWIWRLSGMIYEKVDNNKKEYSDRIVIKGKAVCGKSSEFKVFSFGNVGISGG